MLVNANIKNVRTISLPQFQSPVALLFKDEKVLANHPLSCHPQGVVGSRESERKGEKMREKEKSGKIGALREKSFINGEDNLVTVLVWGFYSQIPFTKYQKNQKRKLLQRTNWEETKNVTKMSKSLKAGKVNSAVRGEQWHRRKIHKLQVAKIS